MCVCVVCCELMLCMFAAGHHSRSRHDISSTHSDNSEEHIEVEEEDIEEEVIIDTRGIELPEVDEEEIDSQMAVKRELICLL